MNVSKPVIIVGGGVSGLCCAQHLKSLGIPFVLLEKSEQLGGRVQTDEVDGYRLDRGFQVLLEAYPACQEMLDMSPLSKHAFGSGAYIFDGSSLSLFADPFRHPRHAIASLLHSAGSLADKLRLRSLQRKLSSRSISELAEGKEETTLAYWQRMGFSTRIQDAFLKPFFRGIFLENEMTTPASMFRFVFAMFGKGNALLPAGGIGAVTDQLVAGLDAACIRTGTAVASVSEHQVTLASGEILEGSAVVVAGDGPLAGEENPVQWNSVTCVYFSSSTSPVSGPWLLLNGSGKGRVNQVALVSQATEGLAPEGRELISVSINGVPAENDQELFSSVREELQGWFGDQVKEWEDLRIYRIEKALPVLKPGQFPGGPPEKRNGVWVCGDAVRHPSLQGAMESGRATAEAVAGKLNGS